MSTIAKLWVSKIIDGTKSYDDVPAKLKKEVKEALIEMRHEDLVSK